MAISFKPCSTHGIDNDFSDTGTLFTRRTIPEIPGRYELRFQSTRRSRISFESNTEQQQTMLSMVLGRRFGCSGFNHKAHLQEDTMTFSRINSRPLEGDITCKKYVNATVVRSICPPGRIQMSANQLCAMTAAFPNPSNICLQCKKTASDSDTTVLHTPRMVVQTCFSKARTAPNDKGVLRNTSSTYFYQRVSRCLHYLRCSTRTLLRGRVLRCSPVQTRLSTALMCFTYTRASCHGR